MTVSGLTITNAERHSVQALDGHTQKNQSTLVSVGRFFVER